MAVQADEIKLYSNPLGGAINLDNLVPIDLSMHNVFDYVTTTQAFDGHTEYRCVYVKNTNQLLSIHNVRLYLGDIAPSVDSTFSAGKSALPVNSVEQVITSDVIAPVDIVFSGPTTYDGGIALGTLAPNDTIAVWLRRVIAPNSDGAEVVSTSIIIQGSSAP